MAQSVSAAKRAGEEEREERPAEAAEMAEERRKSRRGKRKRQPRIQPPQRLQGQGEEEGKLEEEDEEKQTQVKTGGGGAGRREEAEEKGGGAAVATPGRYLLFVGNLPYRCAAEDVRRLFAAMDVIGVRMPTDKLYGHSGHSPPHAHVVHLQVLS